MLFYLTKTSNFHQLSFKNLLKPQFQFSSLKKPPQFSRTLHSNLKSFEVPLLPRTLFNNFFFIQQSNVFSLFLKPGDNKLLSTSLTTRIGEDHLSQSIFSYSKEHGVFHSEKFIQYFYDNKKFSLPPSCVNPQLIIENEIFYFQQLSQTLFNANQPPPNDPKSFQDNDNDPSLKKSNPGTSPQGMIEKSLQNASSFALMNVFSHYFLHHLRDGISILMLEKDEIDDMTYHDFSAIHPVISQNKDSPLSSVLSNVTEEIEQMKDEIYKSEKNAEFQKLDEPSRAQILLCSHVLAAYKVLTAKGFEHQKSLDLINNAAKLQDWIMTLFNRPLIFFGSTPLKSVGETWGKTARLRGEGFTFEIQHDGTYVILNIKVKKCMYSDFFRKNGHSYITPLFCAAEIRMFENVDPMKTNIAFDSPKQIAQGFPHCMFKYKRVNKLEDLQPVAN